MRFIHRLRTIWSWLPAFRAVAETGHLPSAANELHVVASSLSRTVKQLEDELGVLLFDRTTKSLVLNESGKTLLLAVREAMRIVDDALGVAIGDELTGRVGIAASSDLVFAIALPAGADLAVRAPALTLSVTVATSDSAIDLLVRGSTDAVLLSHRISAHDDLQVVDLGSWSRSVFGRPGSAPPYRCVVVGDPSSHGDDGWPPGLERSVAGWVPDERSALELCARTDAVTVAFDKVAAAHPTVSELVRLPAIEIAPRPIVWLHRRALGRHRRTEALVDAIRAKLAT